MFQLQPRFATSHATWWGLRRSCANVAVECLPQLHCWQPVNFHRKAFISALNHTDLDPIYFCEAWTATEPTAQPVQLKLHSFLQVITACPAGPDDADAKLLDAKARAVSAKGLFVQRVHCWQATPSSLSKGDTVQMLCDVNAPWQGRISIPSGAGERGKSSIHLCSIL